MGACNCSNAIDQQEKISKSSYNFSYAVGQGGFGKVWKVVDKKTKEVYALKIMEKHKILTKKSVQSVINEKNILQEIQDDFIVNMKMAFQDKESLYLVLEYLDGGDLRYHLNKCYEYSEEETQFIAASIIQGLEKVHNHNIIHRDLKPENIVFSSNGQLKITDFGIARYYRPDNADQTSGTPGYMAPEVLMKCSHDFLVDYYALGVILFEIIYGERPYLGRNRKEIKQQVLQVQRYLSMDDLPDETWSLESADFVNQLIKRKPANRLGAKGIEQIKSHPWLKNFPWQNLKNGTLQNPFKPRLPEGKPGGSFVSLKVNQAEQQKDKESMRLLRRNSTQRLFQDFDYDPMGILKNQDNRQQENRQDSPTKNQTIAQSAQTNYNSTIEFGSSSKKPLNNRLTNSQNQIQIQSISKLVGNDQKQIEQKQKLEQIIRQKQRQRMQNEVQKQNQNQKQNKYNFNQQEIKSTQQNNKKDSYSQNQSNRQFFNENDSQNQFQNKPRGLSFQTTKRTYSKNLYQNKTPIKRMQNSILGHKLENKERKSFSSLKKQEQQQEQQQYQFSQELQNEQKKEKNYEKKIMGQEVGNKNNLKNDRKSLENSINSIENGKEDQENQGLIQENEKYNQISQIHDSQLEEQLEQGINQRQNNHKNINKNQQRKINMSRQSLMSQDLNQSQIRMHTDEVWEDSPLKK